MVALSRCINTPTFSREDMNQRVCRQHHPSQNLWSGDHPPHGRVANRANKIGFGSSCAQQEDHHQPARNNLSGVYSKHRPSYYVYMYIEKSHFVGMRNEIAQEENNKLFICLEN